MKVAVLALQGAYIEHIHCLQKLGVDTMEIRKRQDLEENFEGLILPGGESTVMGKLLHELNLFNILKAKIEQSLPVFGTCAGMILLAKSIENQETTHFGTMDISVVRNAFGRQHDSFNIQADFNGKSIEMPFIRAPYVEKSSADISVLSTVKDKIVAVRQKNQLACAFHPELTTDLYVHEYFLEMIHADKK